MSIFEYYNANIPLFCPSKSLMNSLYKDYRSHVLSELTWRGTFNQPPGSVIDCDRGNDPNDYNNIDIMSKWIEYSDFYNEEWMPYITYFNTFDELNNVLNNTDLSIISSNMKEFNIVRKDRIYDMWKKILNDVDEKFSNR
jgi:hypothetical protein